MAAFTPQGASLLLGWRRPGRFTKGLGEKMPAAYKKFWDEWKVQKPAPVHFVPQAAGEVYRRNEHTGQVKLNQNVPIPLMSVPEEHAGIWGGEAIIRGFRKRIATKRRVPHYWYPSLELSVVRSEVLNENFEVSVTKRTISNILEHHGFDHYLLKTPACDLRSLLACKIKQRILFDILDQYPAWNHDVKKQQEVAKEFNVYKNDFTPEEIEWYGLSWLEAVKKRMKELRDEEAAAIRPHKEIFRARLLEQLRTTESAMEAKN